MISSSCPYFSSQTTYIHTHTLCSYKILALTSEQQINFYCLHRNIKKHTFFFSPVTVITYHNQCPDRPGGPALGLFQCISLFLAHGSPRLGTELQIQSLKHETASQAPNRREGSLPQTCWLHVSSCSPERGYPSLLPCLTHCKECCWLTFNHHNLQSCVLDCRPTI